MGRLLKEYEKEYMKMAMLKHEQTFREQVNELHRLYHVQKQLMKDVSKSSELKRQHKSAYLQADTGRWNALKRAGFHDRNRPRRRMLDLELSADEYIEDAERDIMLKHEEENEIELTLATGGSRRKKEETLFTSDSSLSFSSSSTDSGGENARLHGWAAYQLPCTNIDYPADRTRSSTFVVKEQALNMLSWQLQCFKS